MSVWCWFVLVNFHGETLELEKRSRRITRALPSGVGWRSALPSGRMLRGARWRAQSQVRLPAGTYSLTARVMGDRAEQALRDPGVPG